MEINTERRLVSIEEARVLAGVSRRTLYNWLADHKVEAIRTAGGSIRIYADTLFVDVNTPTGQSKKKSFDWYCTSCGTVNGSMDRNCVNCNRHQPV